MTSYYQIQSHFAAKRNQKTRPKLLERKNFLSYNSLRGRLVSMTPTPVKPLISLDVLNQIDVRVGAIEAVDDVPGADKLVALRVDFGDHRRVIVAAIKQERADPREVVGKQALFVLNLEPRKMRGVMSEGMLFDIGYADGVTPVLAVPEKPVPNGTRAG